MHIVETLLVLIAACIGFALLARRARLPYAVVLVLGGMALAFIPGVPQVELDPQIALAFFLPPLLQASAYRTDWTGFKGNLRPDPAAGGGRGAVHRARASPPSPRR